MTCSAKPIKKKKEHNRENKPQPSVYAKIE